MRPRRAEGLREVEIDGEVVVYDGATLHLLDPHAATVWQLVDGRGERRIVRALAEAYGADRAEVARDVAALLARLREAGLVR